MEALEPITVDNVDHIERVLDVQGFLIRTLGDIEEVERQLAELARERQLAELAEAAGAEQPLPEQ